MEYLEWLFPDVAACFFPVTKKEDRRFRWPGLGVAMWYLVLEATSFLLGLLLMVITTSVWGFYLVTGSLRDVVIPGLPPATGPKRGERFSVTTLDASKTGQVTPMIIQGFISRSEPVVIKNLPKEFFSAMAPGGKYAPPLGKAMLESGKIVMTTYYSRGHLGGFEKWIRKHVKKRVDFMLRFAGSYGGTAAHMDGVTYNIYYVARGSKRVWICPRQYNHLLTFQSGFNQLYISGSDPDSSDLEEWIRSVPGVWTLELEEGDLLLFNNAGCVHKFENISEKPDIYSVRVLNSDISPILARYHIFNWEQARHFGIGKLVMLVNKAFETSTY